MSAGTAPFFNVRETQDFFADLARASLESVNQPYAEMVIHERRKQIDARGSGPADLVLKGNAVGRILASMLLPSHENFLKSICRDDYGISTLQILLATKCYKADKGTLPTSLEQMVPTYLPAVPRDPFDGKPIRYSAEKKIFYSVGHDVLKPRSVTSTNVQANDYVVPIPF